MSNLMFIKISVYTLQLTMQYMYVPACYLRHVGKIALKPLRFGLNKMV